MNWIDCLLKTQKRKLGKTQLVRSYCRTQVTKGILFRWLDASDISTLEASLLRFAQEAGLILSDSGSNNSGQVLGKFSNQRDTQKALSYIGDLPQSWLLVYDNYDIPESDNFHLRSYFPGGKRGRIIVTSRTSGVATDTGATCLLVESMSVSESIELLKRSARMPSMGAHSLV